jgi:DNA-binding HxlR family transcriptional regulator
MIVLHMTTAADLSRPDGGHHDDLDIDDHPIPAQPTAIPYTSGHASSCAHCGHNLTAGALTPDAFLQDMIGLRHLTNGDWLPDVLLALSTGPRRYTDLLVAIRSSPVIDQRTGRDRNIQPRTLIDTLRRMESDGLIRRHEHVGSWPRAVRYEMTCLAHDLLSILVVNALWFERHQDLIAGNDWSPTISTGANNA